MSDEAKFELGESEVGSGQLVDKYPFSVGGTIGLSILVFLLAVNAVYRHKKK